jgi:heterodisulfide reductase subunit C
LKNSVENLSDYKEIIDVINASGGEGFKFCYQCGLLDTVCPWNRVRAFSMRKVIREANFGLTDIESEEMWRCTTCGNCPRQCPRGVKIIESGVSLRRISMEYGVLPTPVSPLRTISTSLVDTMAFMTSRGKL